MTFRCVFAYVLLFLYVLSKRHSAVMVHSKCGGMVGVWDRFSLFSVTGGCSGCSLLNGVMSVSVDFVVQSFSLFVWSHVSSMYMYYCICVAAISGSGCCEKDCVV